jgi:membrane-bound metal-dependent hydrolase YbcI (DUF457 family)
MANFKTHRQGAVMVGIISSIASYTLGMVNPSEALFVFAAGFSGALAPDLDHDASIPLRFVFRTLAILVPIIAIQKHPELHNSVEEAIGYFVLIALGILFPVRWIFGKFTVHRGIFHSVPAIFIYGALLFLLCGRQRHDIPFQKSMAIASSLGYFAHLLLDEYSSLNFDGHRFKPKRSLGTALDFFKPNKRVTLLAYLILTGLLVVIVPLWNGA